jgi:hypothetical protein
MFKNLIALILIALAVAVPSTVSAQSSSLRGTVTDAQGALIPGVVITATNLDTNAMRSTISDEMGTYAFAQLPPGLYKVQAELPGFSTFVQQVRLQIDTPATVTIRLEVGTVSETVNVLGEVQTINTENATIGNPFTQTQVRQLPLQTRNVVELLSLQPGVTPTGEVIGAKKDQNNVTLDGVDINDNQNGVAVAEGATDNDRRNASGFRAALPVPLDSVQEFRTTVAGQGADQGRSSGGQVSLVTKSGSNAFHGSVYEFHRNKVTAANNWFNNRAGIPRENLIRNQYGASLGGRIVRNRAFFFVNWEDRKDRSASSVSRNVPTETLKQGIVQFRMSNGEIGQATVDEIKAIDPLHIGISPGQLEMLRAYPAGNDQQSGSDRGLNFSTFRFNAPQTRDDRAYVAKLDFNLDSAGKHTVMMRGTLADATRDETVAQFPGQEAAVKQFDTSKGLAARYTTVLSPTMINVFNYGYTRLAIVQSGLLDGPRINWGGITNLLPSDRPSSRVIPTTNFVDDMTWIKGVHTLEFGVNFRFIQNDRTSYNNTYPQYSFSRNTLKGLGADIRDAVNVFIRQKYSNSSLGVTEQTPVANAFGNLLGVLNNYSGTYNYTRDGDAMAFGQPTIRSFATKELDFYVQDTWKVRRDLTLTYGLRYANNQVPYEKNGLQVVTSTPLENFLAERIYAQQNGIPGYAMPNAALTYELGGPVNGGRDWFNRDNNNFAPRFSVAYAPESDGFFGKLFGKGSVLRAGGSILYDRYGSDMVVNFDRSGSPGLSTTVSQPRNTDFTDGFRYTGGGVPELPAAPQGGFPFTPPTIIGGFGSTVGVTSNLVAPYSMLMNLSYTRPLVEGITVEAGYIGRLGRKGLLQQDFFQMLTHFKDTQSGTDWSQAMGQLRSYFDSGITVAQVRANPSLIPTIPFIENIFPRAAGLAVPGSATANYFITTYGTYAASDLDALNAMDRERRPDGTCISVYGCNTFFALQNAGLRTWVNAGNAAFHGGQLVIRRPVTSGWGFDFNYTLSHSIDIQSASESGSGNSGALIQDTFNPKASRASSDFDIRHNVSANSVVELPIGNGKAFFRNMPGWANQLVGGWQISTLAKFRSGLPENVQVSGVYPTNYLSSAMAVLRPTATMPETGVGYNQNGNPSIFSNTNAAQSFMPQYPGTVGTRAIVRGASFFNMDLSLSKTFGLPIEGHRVQFRAEAFNALNNVNFSNLQLSTATTATFGQFSNAGDGRVMQFGLRYEF